MDKLALVQAALRELGDASAQELASFIVRKHGTTIDPKFIPIFKATIRDAERAEATRQAARAAADAVKPQPKAS